MKLRVNGDYFSCESIIWAEKIKNGETSITEVPQKYLTEVQNILSKGSDE